MNISRLVTSTLAATFAAGTLGGMPLAARADTASTAAIVAGAAAIVGALLIDSSGHPYYVRDNHRYYVTSGEAQYYRSPHHVVQRQAWVPEQEYPVARDPYHRH